jgi:hypothetical protein
MSVCLGAVVCVEVVPGLDNSGPKATGGAGGQIDHRSMKPEITVLRWRYRRYAEDSRQGQVV